MSQKQKKERKEREAVANEKKESNRKQREVAAKAEAERKQREADQARASGMNRDALRTLSGHTSYVRSLTVLPSGMLVSGSDDNSIKVWDLGLRPVLAPAAVDRVALLPKKLEKGIAAREAVPAPKPTKYDVKPAAVLPQPLPVKAATLQLSEIRDYVSKLSHKETDVRKSAAWALWNLAVNAENKITIAQAGAIPPLVSLLSDSDTIVRQNASATLWHLSVNAENQITIAKAGAIAPLVGLLSDSDPVVRQNAAGALTYLALNAKNKVIIDQEKQAQLRAAEQPVKKASASPAGASESDSFDEVKNVFGLQGFSSFAGIKLIPKDDVVFGPLLGKGGFGKVYEATWKFQTVAVKCYEGERPPERVAQEVRHEISVMLRLQQDCLVRFFGLIQIENHLPMIVMELGAKGSLYQYLQSNQTISWNLRLRMAGELTRGLAYLHDENIVHRDMKSLNVILDSDYHAKWCDFGLASLKQHSMTTSRTNSASRGLVGTVRWMAPELFERGSSTPSSKSDIWALGMVFFELASRQMPYQDAQNQQQIIAWIQKGTGEVAPEECKIKSPGFTAIMQRCWLERNSRPTAKQLVGEIAALPKPER